LQGENISTEAIRDASFWIVVLGIFGVGLRTDPRRMVKYAKLPIGPLIGIVCQFTIMPSIAMAAVKIANFTSNNYYLF